MRIQYISIHLYPMKFWSFAINVVSLFAVFTIGNTQRKSTTTHLHHSCVVVVVVVASILSFFCLSLVLGISNKREEGKQASKKERSLRRNLLQKFYLSTCSCQYLQLQVLSFFGGVCFWLDLETRQKRERKEEEEDEAWSVVVVVVANDPAAVLVASFCPLFCF